ncbi:uroporphyrinogen decarboxylase family protein [Sodalis sp. dw_96]|uniref:uroporphyrinogen decarboxylase family protein n=1 Tax=Sodalis sp. dw_96 TaxID=2719794 RepID=UPI001BD225EF|nr:uroporphyrinogen decarboxylase family protein [Sodalis sp. dw_96]
MTSTERLKSMLQGKPVDRTAIAGWLHMPLVDRNIAEFVEATIQFTDENQWDFVKVMSNGHYMAEAYGADIRFSSDPTRWSGTFLSYPVKTPGDLLKLPVLDKTNAALAREIAVTYALVQHYRGKVPIVATLFAPLTWIQEMSSSTDPRLTREFMQRHKKALHTGLEALLTTQFTFIDGLLDAGIDGIFLASQFISSAVISREEYNEFCRPYDQAILSYINGKTWFNILHVHGEKRLLFNECLDYDVQAFNWEDAPYGVADTERSSIKSIRKLTDKIIIGGIDQHHDFYQEENNRDIIRARLQLQYQRALKESGGNNFIFAPGCALPQDIPREIFMLLKDIVGE